MTSQYSSQPAPIGVFDSGFGGLSILREIRKELPQYDYIFLGDNARAPYGNRSYQLVYEFTLQAVKYLFNRGCHLVILACNTASAKALRSIQQRDLATLDPSRRVLGVIRPTVEEIGNITKSRKVGLFGTPGTVQSLSYDIEIGKMHPDIKVYSHACPMWVPLVENRESDGPGADYRTDCCCQPERLPQAPSRHGATLLTRRNLPLLHHRRRFTLLARGFHFCQSHSRSRACHTEISLSQHLAVISRLFI